MELGAVGCCSSVARAAATTAQFILKRVDNFIRIVSISVLLTSLFCQLHCFDTAS